MAKIEGNGETPCWTGAGLSVRGGDAGAGAGPVFSAGCFFPLSSRFYLSLGGEGRIGFAKDQFSYTGGSRTGEFSTFLINLGGAVPIGVGTPLWREHLYSSISVAPAFITSFGHFNSIDDKTDAGWGNFTRGGLEAALKIDLFPKSGFMARLEMGGFFLFGSNFSPYDDERRTSPTNIQLTVSSRSNSGYFFQLVLAGGNPPKLKESQAVAAPVPTPPPTSVPPQPPPPPSDLQPPVTPPPGVVEPPVTLDPPTQPPVNLPPPGPAAPVYSPPPSLEGIKERVKELEKIVARMLSLCRYLSSHKKKPHPFPKDLPQAKRDFKKFEEKIFPQFVAQFQSDVQKIIQDAKKYPKDERWNQAVDDLFYLNKRVEKQVALMNQKKGSLDRCLSVAGQSSAPPSVPPRQTPPPPTPSPSVPPPPAPPKVAPAPERPVPLPPPTTKTPAGTKSELPKIPCPEVSERLRRLLQSWSPGSTIRGTQARALSELLDEANIRNEIRGHVFNALRERVREEIKSKRERLLEIGGFSGPYGEKIFKLWMEQNRRELDQAVLGNGLPGLKSAIMRDRFKGLKLKEEDLNILFRTPDAARGGPGFIFGSGGYDLSYCQTANPQAEDQAIKRMHGTLLQEIDHLKNAEAELDKSFGSNLQGRDEALYELLPFVDGEVLGEAIRHAFEDCGKVTPQGYQLVAQTIAAGLKEFQTEKSIRHFQKTAALYALAAMVPAAGAAGRAAIGLYRALALGGNSAAEAAQSLSRARTYHDLGLLSERSLKTLEAESVVSALNQLVPGGNFGVGSLVTAGISGGVFTSLAYHMVDHPDSDEAVIILKGAAQAAGTAIAGVALGAMAVRLRQQWNVAPNESINIVGVSIVKPRKGKIQPGNQGGLVIQVLRRDGTVKETRQVPGTISNPNQNQEGGELTITPVGGSPLQIKIPKGSMIAALPKGCKKVGAAQAAGTSPTDTRGSSTPAGRTPRGGVGIGGGRSRARSTPLGAEEFDVGSYKELRGGYTKGREINEVKQELQMDHVPSKAALFNYHERRLGRALSTEERRAVEEGGVAVALPADLHRHYSQTYGANNTPQQIAEDGRSLKTAFERDAQAYLRDARKFGYNSHQMQKLQAAIYNARLENIRRGVFRN